MIRKPLLCCAAWLVFGAAQAESDFARVEWFAPSAENRPMQLHFASLLLKAPELPKSDDAALAAQWPDLGVGMWPLQALVGQALAHAPAILEAQANALAASHDVGQAQSGLWPRVELSANSPATSLENNGASGMGARAGANVVYNLADFGKTRKQIAGRELQSLSLQDRLRTVRETTAFDTATSYLELIKHQRLENIYAVHIDELQGLVKKLSEIVAVFAGRRSELTQAQTRLGQAYDALLAVQAKERQFKLDLMRQIGSYTRFTNVPDVLPVIPLEPGTVLMETVKTQHPAIRSAAAEASAARAQVEEAQAGQKPQVDLVLSSQSGLDANGFAAPTQLYVTAKWVAFDGYGGKNSEQALQERALAAEARAGQVLQDIEFKIQSAQASYRSLAWRVSELTGLLSDTDQVRKDYYDQWRELGRRSLLDVLSAENEHLSTQLSLATAQVDQVQAAVRMRHEAGGFQTWLLGEEPARAAEHGW
jgi:adhesin transport system outer membrane protein